ncbi:MAG: radical SAM protein, partial [Planctomycetota bacterium]
MELPRRLAGDEFLPDGSFSRLRNRLADGGSLSDIRALFVYAFDFRTRVGPFVYFDKLLIPGAPLSIGAALKSVGINHLRLVLQQWTPNIRPSQTTIAGQSPDLLLVSSMQIHSAASYELIRDAWRLGEDRPLILAGGSKAIYEPWDYFGLDESGNCGADVVVTGEEYVVLELLEIVAAHRGSGESLRTAFDRVRREGLLDSIPGLVYRPDDANGPPAELMHTGIQRLVQNLDVLPSVTTVLDHFEPPHRKPTLSNQPLAARRLRRYSKIAALVTTHGCKFRCSYCPIPGYNQFTFRHKSSERLAEDMGRFYEATGIDMFFGTDDNLFNSRSSIEEMFTGLANARLGEKQLTDVVSWATEATEFDVWKNRDLLPLARKAGLRLIWFGIEDMTAELIK